jgi:hypothetical protein
MSTDAFGETAKIYAFPSRARNNGIRQREQAAPLTDLVSRRLPRVEFGSGWYHDAAIEDAQTDARR